MCACCTGLLICVCVYVCVFECASVCVLVSESVYVAASAQCDAVRVYAADVICGRNKLVFPVKHVRH
jgi:hypothetical protein